MNLKAAYNKDKKKYYNGYKAAIDKHVSHYNKKYKPEETKLKKVRKELAAAKTWCWG
jgi:hypothetical protein